MNGPWPEEPRDFSGMFNPTYARTQTFASVPHDGPTRDAWGRTTLPQDCRLPPYCPMCGIPQHGAAATTIECTYIHVLVYVAGIFLGLPAAFLTYHLTRKQARFVGHICPSCDQQLQKSRQREQLFVWLSLVSLVAGFILPIPIMLTGVFLQSMVLIAAGQLSVLLLLPLHLLFLFVAALTMSTAPLRVTNVQSGPHGDRFEMNGLHPNVTLAR